MFSGPTYQILDQGPCPVHRYAESGLSDGSSDVTARYGLTLALLAIRVRRRTAQCWCRSSAAGSRGVELEQFKAAKTGELLLGHLPWEEVRHIGRSSTAKPGTLLEVGVEPDLGVDTPEHEG